MYQRDGFEGCTCFRKLEDDMAARAIAESEEPVGVNIFCREENFQRHAPDGSHPSSVGQQGHDPSQHLAGPAEEGLSAVKVHRECYMSVRGEIISAATLILVKTNAVVSKENCGPRALAAWPR